MDCVLIRNETGLWDVIDAFKIERKNYKYNDIIEHKLYGKLRVLRQEEAFVVCVLSYE